MKSVRRFFKESEFQPKKVKAAPSQINPDTDEIPQRILRGDSSIKQIDIDDNTLVYNGSLIIITHLASGEIICESDADIRVLYKDPGALRKIKCIGDTVAYYQT